MVRSSPSDEERIMSIGNWIAENSQSTGAGALTLTGAVLTFTRFRDAIPAGGVWYSIEDANGNREAGYGTFDGTDGLARTEVNATLINGVYNGTNPVAINLSGSQVVAVTFNEQAYVDLLANISANASNISINASAISANTSAIALNTTHRGLTDNPHSVTATQVAYDPTNDPTSSETDVQAALVDHGGSIEERVTTLSGVITGGLISGSGATFDVEFGTGIISDTYTDPSNSTVDPIQWNTQAGITIIATRTVGNISIFIDSLGAVVQVEGNPSLSLYRYHIYLGFIVQQGGVVSEINNAPSIVKQTATDTYDLLRHKINVSGLDIRPHNTALSIWLSDGTVFFPGINWHTDSENPNVMALPPYGSVTVAAPYEAMTQTGAITGTFTIIPDAYNTTGDTLVGLSGNNATIHRLYGFGIGANRKIVLLYGQNEYNNAGVAKRNLATDDDGIVLPTELSDAYFLGYVCVDGQANDFADPNKTWIVSEGGSASGSTSVPTSAINVSYDNTTSGLTSTNVQDAIAEVDVQVDTNITSIQTNADDITALQNALAGAMSPVALASFDGALTGTNPPTYGVGVTSVERVGAGRYTVNLTEAMADVNYVAQITSEVSASTGTRNSSMYAKTTTSFSLNTQTGNGANSDATSVSILVFGVKA